MPLFSTSFRLPSYALKQINVCVTLFFFNSVPDLDEVKRKNNFIYEIRMKSQFKTLCAAGTAVSQQEVILCGRGSSLWKRIYCYLEKSETFLMLGTARQLPLENSMMLLFLCQITGYKEVLVVRSQLMNSRTHQVCATHEKKKLFQLC